ncbi:MAG: alpha/beta fold hydrolase [Alphaproteobacteria bacterium]|uniref:alpha/beta hydrolase n=1 Tax=Pacificispira sp. TaxID=2888761 RepID=UPI001B10FC34|nr:alpha/beta fold hydrolase [Alphaproteobacteria bacterium]MBO6863898.1 alpha/beta fold hydrolase [Alphaproteobacteria bacterium]
MTDAALTGPEHAPATGEAPDRLIVFLHGLGANGNDLISLAPILAQVFPRAHFVAPDAPDPCDLSPMGRQWFSMQDLKTETLFEGVKAAAPSLDAFLDQQMDRFGLTPDRVAVVGFSQGTMLALHTLIRREQPIAAILGYSGMLIAPGALADDLACRPPTLLIHGEEDEVVPPEMSRMSGEALKIAGFDVEVAFCKGLGHSIDEPGLRLGVEFLLRAFGDKPVEDEAANDAN